jgi:hypothetical protein
MNIVLVCANNFQEYILLNIKHLIKLGHKNIYVITNAAFFERFSEYKSDINLVELESLQDTYEFDKNTTLDKEFRNGFWKLASSRFFYTYAFMKQYSIEDVIHIENDVLLYYNCDELVGKVDKDFMYLPFDTFQRNIASIVYIPSHELLKEILDEYDPSINDMYNFSNIMEKTQKVKNFPIFINNGSEGEEYKFVTNNFDTFKYIFDAAAIGQFLGGVDPLNMKNSVGFINETCIIKYDKYQIKWKNVDGINKPFIVIDSNEYPIFNLHVHCKDLNKFINFEFDIVIPVGPNDKEVIESQIISTRNNIIGYRNIYLVSYDSKLFLPGCITIDERIFPFSIKDTQKYIIPARAGWYLQQLLKLYSGFVIEDILDRYLVIDSDTYFLKKTNFIYNNKCLYNFEKNVMAIHKYYFFHMKKLHPSFGISFNINGEYRSGICHHMLFEKKYLKEIFDMVKSVHNKEFWVVFLQKVISRVDHGSDASEYEIYFHYMVKNHPNEILIRPLNWVNVSSMKNIESYDYVSYHHYMRSTSIPVIEEIKYTPMNTIKNTIQENKRNWKLF